MISNFLPVISFANYYCEGYTEIHFGSTLKSPCAHSLQK